MARAARSQLERAVRGDLSFVGRDPVPVQVARVDELYVSKGLDRNRLGATVRMVGPSDAQWAQHHCCRLRATNLSRILRL